MSFNLRFDQFFIHSTGALWFNGQHLWSVHGNNPWRRCFGNAGKARSGHILSGSVVKEYMNSGLAFARFKQKGYQ
ncbi:hypothetical protein DDT56_10555 [Brenneria corticis]|uniref:Uncharacterized protein n=1 Tax=Brenneria corticis TaxID=2173106 RepID=A0A2U1U2Q7_9GAMM|nr:hypothetical protein DDT56_10555 [Brenneria sp. CFCC 11842]